MSDEETTTMDPIPDMAPEELQQLAVAVSQGHVWVAHDEESLQPFEALLALAGTKWLPGNLGLIYEYMSAASPMACNGLPVFFSLKCLSMDDADRLRDIVESIRAAISTALGGEVNTDG